jgi:hypothetical protein
MTDTAAVEVEGSYWDLRWSGGGDSQFMGASVFRPAKPEENNGATYRQVAAFSNVTLIAFADEVKALADVEDVGAGEGESRIIHP